VLTLINGQVEQSVDKLAASFASFDGVFETILVCAQQPVMWAAHLERLLRGCSHLQLPIIESTQWYTEMQQALDGENDAIVKIIVMSNPVTREPMRIVSARPYPQAIIQRQQGKGIKVIFCNTVLKKAGSSTAIKHLNRCVYSAAAEEVEAAGVDDGLLCNDQEQLIESTIANVFIAKQGCVLTPDVSEYGIQGLAREVILSNAKRCGLPINATTVTREMCMQADEIFLCNSVRGILPVVAVGKQNFPIGTITRQLQSREMS
jgi:4-amino-4-deoxychorismate lyase